MKRIFITTKKWCKIESTPKTEKLDNRDLGISVNYSENVV